MRETMIVIVVFAGTIVLAIVAGLPAIAGLPAVFASVSMLCKAMRSDR